MKNKPAILLCCLGMMACTNDHWNELYPQAGVCATDTIQTVSFSRNIQPVFTQNCALGGCHNSITQQSNLNLDSGFAYLSLMRAGSGYIDTAAPLSSLLYSQMRSASTPMPPTGLLDTCTLNLVLKWISQKAPNN